MNKINGYKQVNIREIVLLSILTALGVILSIIDKQISILVFPFLPTAKIGLANIIILIAVMNVDVKKGLLMTILKSTLVGLILGSITSFIIGGIASLLAFLGMTLTKLLFGRHVSCVGISVVGGFLHIIGQLFVTFLMYQLGEAVFAYGAFLIGVSLLTSVLVGFVGNKLMEFMKTKDIFS